MALPIFLGFFRLSVDGCGCAARIGIRETGNGQKQRNPDPDLVFQDVVMKSEAFISSESNYIIYILSRQGGPMDDRRNEQRNRITPTDNDILLG